MGNLIYGLLGKVGYFHPLHPILVHITLGTVIAAFLFAVGRWLFGKPGFYTTARQIMVLSFFSAFLTIALGLIDWSHFYDGQIFNTITMKIVLGIVLVILQGATIVVNRKTTTDSKLPIVFYSLCLLDGIALGFYGANLVY
jgi:uncharacterized membrane protein